MQTTQPTVTTSSGPTLPLSWIHASTLNPRKHFDQDALDELASSIQQFGLIEPIAVRRISAGNYEIVAGERRWRAATQIGLAEVPVHDLGEISDADALKLALIENLQRQDLDPIEEAEGYRQLNRIVGLKQSAIAAAVNRSQPAVANAMRLLDLPEDVQERIRTRELSVSHGIALCRFNGFPALQQAIVEMAIDGNWPSKAIEKDIPGIYQLEHKGVLQQLYMNHGTVGFPDCEHCPFDARRALNHGAQYCLRPDHYRELDAARKQARENESVALLAARGVEASQLPHIVSLQSDTYAMFYSDRPAACSDQCPCYREVLGYNDEPRGICSDPKRYRQLKTVETRQNTKMRREEGRDKLQQVMRMVDSDRSVTSWQNLAILASAALARVRKSAAIVAAAKRHFPELTDQKWDSWGHQHEAFVKLVELADRDADRVFKFMIEALLRDQITSTYTEGYTSDHAQLDFFIETHSSLLSVLGDEPASEAGE